jgi:fructokinase
MLDPNLRPGLIVAGDAYRERLTRLMALSTIVKASEADIRWLMPGLDYVAAAEDIINAGAQLVVVTLGSRGAFAIAGSRRVSVQAPIVDVVDTIGAGDAFSAGFLAWLYDHDCIRVSLELESDELQSALDFGCLTASLTCTRAGAESPTRAEIDRVRAMKRAD